ncbi:hypothetical protein CC79DRAFT_1332697 [Sarocladium strictum]
MPSQKSQLPGLPGFDPDNIQPWTVTVVVSMTVFALVSVGLRLLSRHLKSQKLWWDDWMILFSMGWNLVVVGFIFAMHSCGMGIHADLLDPKDIVMMAKWLVVAEILYAFNLGWTKLSLLLMYYRIFHVPYFKKMAWVVGAFVMAWVVCITFLFIFICVPVEKLWYPELPGRCINQVATWIANAASTILTDLIILLMPLPQLWKLRLKKREKIGLTFAFSLGFFVVFASAYRTSILFTYTATDPSYSLAPTVGWTAIEMSAGIVSTNLPTLLPALNVLLRLIGIRTPNGTLGSTPSKGFRSTEDKIKSTPSAPGLVSETGKPRDAFYRLSDDEDGSETSANLYARSQTPMENKLRPDTMGFKYTVESYSREEREEESGDDIPLHAIRVKTDFEKKIDRQ